MGKQVIVTLGNILERKGISLNELSLMTGVRRAALSELSNSKRENINFRHISKIAEALNISDIREIITIVETDEELQN